MLIDVTATSFTDEQAEEILDYLYRYYHGRERGEGEHQLEVDRIRDWGFGGLTRVIEMILESNEMTERVRDEFDELWKAQMRGTPTSADRERWESALKHARALARERFAKNATLAKEKLSEALEYIDSDYPRAQLLLEEARDTSNADWDVYHYLGLALLRQGKYLEAIPCYEDAINRNDDDDWVWSCDDLKHCYEFSGLPDRFERGLEYFETLVKRYPERWGAYHECGWMLRHLNRLDEAIPYYKKALSLRGSDTKHPEWGWTADDLYQIYDQLESMDEAYEYFVGVSEDQSKDWGVWYARARLERDHLGESTLAATSFERAIALKCPYWVFIDYGWCLRDLGQNEKALDVFLLAKDLDPQKWEAWHGAGWLLRNRGDLAEAKQHFEEALRCEPESAWSWYELGFVYQTTSRAFPSDVNAWEAFQRALVAKKDTQEASEAANEAIAELEKRDVPWQPLRPTLNAKFGPEDLQILCFDLGVDYDNLKGETKNLKVIEMLKHCRRHDKTLRLLSWIHDNRPTLLPALIEFQSD